MKLIKILSAGFALMLLATTSFAQNSNGLLDSLPTTKEGFIKSEPAVINSINWFENTPSDQDTTARKAVYAFFLAWLTNSPTVTVEFNSKIANFTDKNPDLLFIFMGGWTKYSLQNGYSKDPVKCNLAGVRSAIKVYQRGNNIKKDKKMEQLIALDSKNELEQWIASQVEQK